MLAHPLIAVTASVLLGLVSAVLLKETSSQQELSWLLMGMIFLAVMFVNGLRFVLWGIIHQKHQISLTYPLNSLFFPLIFIVGHFYYGEPVVFNKIIGIVLIVSGVSIITYFDSPGPEDM